MSKLLTGSIDLSKIDKTKIVDRDKNGNLFSNGAKYLNVVRVEEKKFNFFLFFFC
jgi:hypothetical protein